MLKAWVVAPDDPLFVVLTVFELFSKKHLDRCEAILRAKLRAQGFSRRGKGWAPELLVRKLALAAEPCGTTVILLTDASRPRAAAWPVALRLELSRPRPERMTVRVAKDKRGRIGVAKTVSFRPVLRVAGWGSGE